MASIFSGKTGRNAATFGAQTLADARDSAIGRLKQGFDFASGEYGNAQARFEPFTRAYAGAPGALADAYGLNGAEGQQRTLASLQSFNPAYSFLQQQGEQGVLRNAASRGRLAGGQTSTDLMSFNQGLAMDKVYQPYLQGLGQLNSNALQVAGARAGLDTGLAGLGNQYGQNQASLIMDTGKETAGIGMGGMMAGQQAAANRFGALTSAVQGGLSAIGQFAGGGMGGLGQMGSLFGGGGGATGGFGSALKTGAGLY